MSQKPISPASKDHSFERDMFRLHKEIVKSDKKLIEKLMKSSNGREVFYPIYKEVNNTHKYLSTKLSEYESELEQSLDNSKLRTSQILNQPESRLNESKATDVSGFHSKNLEKSADIRAIIKKVFMFYVSFGDRLNTNNLKANKLYKMMHDAYILDENITKKTLDLLFIKHSKTKAFMDFESFLSLLINIGSMKFPSLDPKAAFLELFSTHFKPLYQNLYRETDMGDYDALFKEPLEDETIEALRVIAPVISKLHKVYFTEEYQLVETSDTRKRSEGAMSTLLKEFDICPNMLSHSISYNLLQEIFDTSIEELTRNPNYEYILQKDEGKVFTINRFLAYLARLSLLVFSQKVNENKEAVSEMSQNEKLIVLLEKMEFSLGFANFEKKMNTTRNSSTSLLPPKLKINSSKYELNQSILNKSHRNKSYSPLGHTNPNAFKTKSPDHSFQSRRRTLEQSKEMSFEQANRSKSPMEFNTVRSELKEQSLNVITKHIDLLKQLFRNYCSVGTGNKWKIKITSFIKMLRDVNLLKDTLDVNHKPILQKSMSNNLIQKAKAGKNYSFGVDQRELDLFIVKLTSSSLNKSQHSISRENISISPRINLENITESSSHTRLTFEQFLKVLEFVATKAFADVEEEEGMLRLIEDYLSKLVDNKSKLLKNIDTKSHLKKLMRILKEPAVVDILGKLKKSLHSFYSFYSEEGVNMDFAHFLKFCRDFEIFPHILPRSKLMELFYNLASLHPFLSKQRQSTTFLQETQKEHPEENGSTIDENLFVEALALCAAEIEDGISAHIVDKISYLLERMGEASGPKNLQKSLRNTNKTLDSKKGVYEVIHYIKSKYSDIIQNKREGLSQKRKLQFNELFSDEK